MNFNCWAGDDLSFNIVTGTIEQAFDSLIQKGLKNIKIVAQTDKSIIFDCDRDGYPYGIRAVVMHVNQLAEEWYHPLFK